MEHKVYKITNNINGKIYIGVTKDILENRFNGHSKANSHIGNAIRKYGTDNFSIECMYTFDTKEESYNKEAEIVNEDFLKREDVYNAKLGGEGGWDHCNNNSQMQREKALKGNSVQRELRLTNPKNFIKQREAGRKNLLKAHKEGKIKYDTFTGKKHTEQTKKKISEKLKIISKGSNNSQFGTIWIYNLEEKLSKKIKEEELSEYENLGWIKGRKMKF